LLLLHSLDASLCPLEATIEQKKRTPDAAALATSKDFFSPDAEAGAEAVK